MAQLAKIKRKGAITYLVTTPFEKLPQVDEFLNWMMSEQASIDLTLIKSYGGYK